MLSLQLGDVIDARDEEMGAWFEARIVKISPVSDRASVGFVSKQTSDKQEQHEQQSSSTDEVNSNSDKDGDSSIATSTNATDNVKTDDAAAATDDEDGFLYHIAFEQSVSALLLLSLLLLP